MKKLLGIIPAKGVSRGLPGKNIRLVAGKPMLAWSIEAALQSGVFDRLMVSTDDTTIRDLAEKYGVKTPCLRPKELAGDDTPTAAVVIHVLDWLEKNEDYRPDHLMLLQPTSPLRSADDIRAAYHLFQKHGARPLISVAPVQKHPDLMVLVQPDGSLTKYLPEALRTRRQDRPVVHIHNGAIYVVEAARFRQRPVFDNENAVGFVMPFERSIDIDTELDLQITEILLHREQVRSKTPAAAQPS